LSRPKPRFATGSASATSGTPVPDGRVSTVDRPAAAAWLTRRWLLGFVAVTVTVTVLAVVLERSTHLPPSEGNPQSSQDQSQQRSRLPLVEESRPSSFESTERTTSPPRACAPQWRSPWEPAGTWNCGIVSHCA